MFSARRRREKKIRPKVRKQSDDQLIQYTISYFWNFTSKWPFQISPTSHTPFFFRVGNIQLSNFYLEFSWLFRQQFPPPLSHKNSYAKATWWRIHVSMKKKTTIKKQFRILNTQSEKNLLHLFSFCSYNSYLPSEWGIFKNFYLSKFTSTNNFVKI